MRKVSAVVAVSIALAGCGAHPASDARLASTAPQLIRWAIAKPAHVVQTVELTGSIAARHVAVVAAQQSGRVETLSVREGDAVTTGETIGNLDAATYVAGAASAAGTEEAANAATHAAQADIADADAALSGTESSFDAAAASASNALTHARRIASLYAQGAVSREFRDDAVTASDRAQAGLKASEAAIEQARSAAASARAHAAMATGQSIAAQGDAQQASANLGQTRIVAPFDGVVTKRWLDIGAYASPGTPIVTIESTGELDADLSVPEEDAGAIVPGARLALRLDALGDRIILARIRALIPSSAENSHQYVATLEVPYNRSVLPGMFVRARVAARTIEGVGVPAAAVTSRVGQNGVFILDDGRATFQPVIVDEGDGTTTIVNGLAAGAHVALDPSDLHDGDAITESPQTAAMSR